MTILGFISAIALGLFILGFFLKPYDASGASKYGYDSVVIYMIDIILWFVWAYMVFNEAQNNPIIGNNYVPLALAIIGAGFVLVGIYKLVTDVVENLSHRPRQMTFEERYEDDKRRNHQHIYNITRRRF